VSEFYGVDSEVGRLRTVLVHRPGAELRRVTPQQRCGMLLPSPPWAERAQAEHDTFADALRAAGVVVLYLTELLQDALEYAAPRAQAIATAISDPRLGDDLRGQLGNHLTGLSPEELAQVLIMGMAREEFRGGRGAVFGLLSAWDYVIDPLPNLVFARDTCVWIGDSVAVASPQGRRREAELAEIVFEHHPMFAGTKRLYEPGHELLAGGDVLLLAPGVVGIGTGAQTSPAGLERLARRVFETGFAHTVLAVLTDPATPECLDTLCTFAGPDTVLMRPWRGRSRQAVRGCACRMRGRSLRRPRMPWALTGCGSSRPGSAPAGAGRRERSAGRPGSGTTRETCSSSARGPWSPMSATR
jgi:arginine deiminase